MSIEKNIIGLSLGPFRPLVPESYEGQTGPEVSSLSAPFQQLLSPGLHAGGQTAGRRRKLFYFVGGEISFSPLFRCSNSLTKKDTSKRGTKKNTNTQREESWRSIIFSPSSHYVVSLDELRGGTKGRPPPHVDPRASGAVPLPRGGEFLPSLIARPSPPTDGWSC